MCLLFFTKWNGGFPPCPWVNNAVHGTITLEPLTVAIPKQSKHGAKTLGPLIVAIIDTPQGILFPGNFGSGDNANLAKDKGSSFLF